MASSARIDELRKKFEENPRRYFAPLANEYRKAGEIDQAVAICREYLPQQPGHMSGHIVYGQALYEARQFEEAKAVFETALSLDPENLIALRHLGDIALVIGDNQSARTWYRRVLEADPRNEEIQGQLATLDQAAAKPDEPQQPLPTPTSTPAAPIPSPAVARRQPWATKATPSSAPTAVVSARTPPTQAPAQAQRSSPQPTPDSPTEEIRLDDVAARVAAPEAVQSDAGTLDLDLPVSGSAPAPPASEPTPAPLELESINASSPDTTSSKPTPGIELESPVAGATAGIPSTEALSLDGLETTSLAASEAPTAPPEPATLSDSAPVASAPAALPDLDFGTVTFSEPALVSPEATQTIGASALPDLDFRPSAVVQMSSAQAAYTEGGASSSPVETASAPHLLDLDLSAPTEPTTASAPAPQPARSATTPADVAEFAGFEVGNLGASQRLTPPTESSTARLETPAQPQELVAPAERELGVAADGEAAAPPETGPFVTETMAELYLQQGHREEALRVYRALLEQRQGDGALRAKVTSLESELVAPLADTPVNGPESAVRLTIRELLVRVALRRPGFTPDVGHNGAPQSLDATSSLSASSRPDSLGALFGAVNVGQEDERAATALALAFAHANGGESDAGGASARITGAPAHQATNELSLDSVFSSGNAAPPSNFSFDQFFSQRAAPDQGEGSSPNPSVAPTEDVAQFTNWLEGLKQR